MTVAAAPPAKTVTVGAQSGTMTQGVPYETVSFPISTSGIASGTYTVTLNGAPAGISLYQVNTVFINSAGNGTLELEGNSTGSTPAGNHSMSITINGTTSNTFTLKINAVAGKTVTVGTQVGTMTAGVYGSVTFPVTVANIPNGSYVPILQNAPTGVDAAGNVNISAGSGTLTLTGVGSHVAGVYNTMRLTISGTQSNQFTLTISVAPNPTAINFGSTTTYYTYPGRQFPVNYTLTPSGADPSKITWSSSTNAYLTRPYVLSTGSTSANIYVNSGGPSNSMGFYSYKPTTNTLTATLPNSASASVTINTRLVMLISINSNMTFPNSFNTSTSHSWRKVDNKKFVRAYYPADATQWAVSETASPEMYLTKIGTSNYTITSLDPDITCTKMADGITWELTRTSSSVLKEITIIITVGSGDARVAYPQVMILSD
jgi:hypothetical protein